jgi:hypothetical protein
MFSESCNAVLKQSRRGGSTEHRNHEEKTQASYFSHRRRPPESRLKLNGRNIL